MRLLLAIFLIASFTFRTAVTALVNVSIDDTFGDQTGNHIKYLPDGAWLPNGCTRCGAVPDSSMAFNSTWQYALFVPPTDGSAAQRVSASVQFTGVAVYVICILTGSVANPDGNTDMAFVLDNTEVAVFQRPPDETAAYQYSQVVFNATDLKPGLHNITLISGQNGSQAIVLLDRIIYTVDTDITSSSPSLSTSQSPGASSTSPSNLAPSSSSSSSHRTNTVGAVVGTIGGVALVFSVLCWVFHQKRRRRTAEEMQAGIAVEPFVDADAVVRGGASPTAATASPSSDAVALNALTAEGKARRVRAAELSAPRRNTRASDYATPSHGSGSTGTTSNSSNLQRSPSTTAVVSDKASGSRSSKRALKARHIYPPSHATPSSPDETHNSSSASGSGGGSSSDRRRESRPLPTPPSAQRAQNQRQQAERRVGLIDEDAEELARYHRKILESTAPRGRDLNRVQVGTQPPSPAVMPMDQAPPPPPPQSPSLDIPPTTLSTPVINLPSRFRGGDSTVSSNVTAPPPYGSSEVGRSPQIHPPPQ